MNEESIKERLEKEFEYAYKKYRKINRDIEIMLDGFSKECFEPACNIELLKEVQSSYFGLAITLKRALIDIQKKEKEDGR